MAISELDELVKFMNEAIEKGHISEKVWVPSEIKAKHPHCFVVQPDFAFIDFDPETQVMNVAVDPDIDFESWNGGYIATYRSKGNCVYMDLLKDKDGLRYCKMIDQILWRVPAVWYSVGEK